jgi:hypothetical protein
VALGDDAIRQTRAALKGTVGAEHDLVTGVHRIPTGNTASRPPAGKQGRLYGNSQTGRIEYDTGAEWKATATTTAYAVNVWAAPLTQNASLVFEQNLTVASTVVVQGQFWIAATPPVGTYAVMEVTVTPTPAAYYVNQVYNKEFEGPVFYTVPVLLCRSGVTAIAIRLWLNPAASALGYLQGVVMVK